MIRDPDGSVREKPDSSDLSRPKPVEGKSHPTEIASGLPMESTKPKHIQRLEKSRKQLEQFRKTGVWDEL